MADPKTSIFIATPSYDGKVECTYATSLLALCIAMSKAGIGYALQFHAGDALIARARNELVGAFLNSSCTHLLFVDSDIGGFTSADLVAMVAADVDVIAGIYPKKEPGGDAFAVCPLDDGPQTVDARGVVELKWVGTGFLLIKRAVFEKMIAKLGPDVAYRTAEGEVRHVLFDTCINRETGKFTGEDFGFCIRWRDMGGRIFGYLPAKLTHTGRFAFAREIKRTRASAGAPSTLTGVRPDRSESICNGMSP
jgi:hypothetical protein